MKVLPVLCAISCSQRWNLLKNKIVDELGSTISSSTEISYLICYVQMMEKCKKDPQLFHQQFEVFESVLYKVSQMQNFAIIAAKVRYPVCLRKKIIFFFRENLKSEKQKFSIFRKIKKWKKKIQKIYHKTQFFVKFCIC